MVQIAHFRSNLLTPISSLLLGEVTSTVHVGLHVIRIMSICDAVKPLALTSVAYLYTVYAP